MRRLSGPEILYKYLGVTHSYSYLNWYNSSPYPFLCSFSPYQNFEDEIFVRWLECNTPRNTYLMITHVRCMFLYHMCHIFAFLFKQNSAINVFLCPVTCRIIKEEKREIDKFIQFNQSSNLRGSIQIQRL